VCFINKNFKFIGARYNDEIYFYMSRGILNPNILETIPNEQVLQSVMVAPSIILCEAWNSQEFKNFYTSIFNNLFEDTPEERKILLEEGSVEHAALKHLPHSFGYDEKKWESGNRYHYRWNITEEEI
jgi:hypothetical protein